MKPGLYIFHPGCEISIANAYPNFHLPKLIQQFEVDLAVLPFILANKNEGIMVDRIPSDDFLKYLSLMGFAKVQFIPFQEYITCATKYELKPWCYSPYLKEKLDKLSENNLAIQFPPTDSILSWQSKVNSLDFCKQIIQNQPSFFIPMEKTGQVFSTIKDIQNYIEQEKNVVLKAPISSSGRGNLFIRNAKISAYHMNWIQSFLDKQKYIVAEPFWNKKLDLAAEFYKESDNIEFVGFSFFETNSNGFYQSNYLNFSKDDFAKKFPGIDLYKWIQIIKEQLLTHNSYQNYNGYLGVDAMIIETSTNQYLMHPCNEINARQTMGLVACFLEKVIHPQSQGKFFIYAGKEKSFKKFSSEMSLSYPKVYKQKKAFSGFFPLTEATKDSIFGAYMLLS